MQLRSIGELSVTLICLHGADVVAVVGLIPGVPSSYHAAHALSDNDLAVVVDLLIGRTGSRFRVCDDVSDCRKQPSKDDAHPNC